MKLLHLLFIIMTSYNMIKSIVMSALRTQLYTRKMLITRKCPEECSLTVAFTN